MMIKKELKSLCISKSLLSLLAMFVMLLAPQRVWAEDVTTYNFTGVTAASGADNQYDVSSTSGNEAKAWKVKNFSVTDESYVPRTSYNLSSESFGISDISATSSSATIIDFNLESDFTLSGDFVSAEITYSTSGMSQCKAYVLKAGGTYNTVLTDPDVVLGNSPTTVSLRGSSEGDKNFNGQPIIFHFIFTTDKYEGNSGAFSIQSIKITTATPTTSATNYNLVIAGTEVTSANKDDVFGNGKVSYTPAEGSNPAILTLSGASINGAIEGSENLTVVLVGSNSITVPSGGNGAAFISSTQANSPTLTFVSEHALTDVLNIYCQCSDIKDIVSGYSIHNIFYRDQNSANWAWNWLIDSDNIVGVKIYQIERYGLWLGSIQFTSEDLGAGQSGDVFQFDPANNRLTLNNIGDSYATSSIECNISDFKIQLNGENYIKKINYTAPDQMSVGALTISKDASSQANVNSLTLRDESGVITGFTTVTIMNPLQVTTPATVPGEWNSSTTSAVITDDIETPDGGLTPLSLTVSLQGWTYGATPNTPTVTGNTGNGTTTFFYKVKDAADDTYVAYPGTQTLNAGDYTIKVEVAATANYASGSATNNFTIAKANMSMVSVSYEDLVYNGESQQLFTVNNVPEDATVKYFCQKLDYSGQLICDPNEDMFSTTVPSATNAGYYGIIYKIEGTNNYNGTEASQTYSVQIVAATIDVVTLDKTSMEYTGAAQTVTITSVKAGDLELGSNDYTVSYEMVVTGEAPVPMEDLPIELGTYNVVVTGKGNFTGSVSKSFTITKAQLKNLSVSLAGWTYGATANTPTVSGNLGNGGITYTYSVNTENPEDQVFTPTVPENAGSYIVKATVAETTNYASGSATANFTITRAVLPVGGENGLKVTLAGWTYGAEHAGPTVTGNAGDGAETFFYKVKDAADETYVTYPGTQTLNAGEYTIKVEVAETDNYASGSATANFTIDRAELPVGGENGLKVTLAGWTYGAQHAGPTVSNKPGNGTVTYTYKEDKQEVVVFSETEPTNVGSYIVKATVAESDNYYGGEAQATFAILPAEITNVTLVQASFEYTGEPQTVIESVEADDLVLTANDYTVIYEMVITGEAPASVDAPVETGTYNVIVTGQGNYTGTKSASFTIINRTLSANEVTFHKNWATYCSLDEDVNLPSGIGAYVATGLGNGVVTLTQISYIPAEVPVLLNNATNSTTENTEFDFNLLEYASENIEVDDVKYYGLYNGKFMRVTGTIPEGRVYLYAQIPEAPELTIVIDGETTGVNDVRSQKAEVGVDLYDLQGRKVQKPSKRGLYIQKGHKVVVNK